MENNEILMDATETMVEGTTKMFSGKDKAILGLALTVTAGVGFAGYKLIKKALKPKVVKEVDPEIEADVVSEEVVENQEETE